LAVRVQVILDEQEKELFQREARREGLSLSAWLRRAGEERFQGKPASARIDTVEALRAFFSACDRREEGREPDWHEHLAVMEASKRSGTPEA
jgi:hypothetical protein